LVLKPFDPDIRRVLIPVVEAILAALTSFTLVGPLGLPWWLPLVCLAVAVGMSVGLRSLAVAKRRWLGEGLAVMRTLQPRNRLVGFVLVAVFAQIARNWLLLHAVGVEASLFDAIALLIAVVTLGQLSFGLSVGAAASRSPVRTAWPRRWPPGCSSARPGPSAGSASRRGLRSTAPCATAA
jgi:hypothetical protein